MDPAAFDSGQAVTAAEVYAERARQLIRQPTAVQWKGADDPYLLDDDRDEENTRGEKYSDLIQFFSAPLLRTGSLLQFMSLLSMLLIYHANGGTNAFTFDLYNISERLRLSPTFTLLISALLCGYLGGCMCILGFHAFLADSGKLAKGFRAGSKILGAAVNLDLIVTAIRLVAFVYAYHFLATRWWLHYQQTKVDFSLFYFTSIAHGFSQILYGIAYFYLEAYHDEGTSEEFGWSALILYGLTGACELSTVFTGFGAFFCVMQLLALGCTIIWAFSFEPLLAFHDVPMHDRVINSEELEGPHGRYSAHA